MTRPGRPARKVHPAVIIVACALLSAALYVPTLKYALVWDDVDLVTLSRTAPLDAFSHSFWQGGSTRFLGSDPYYRPLVNLTIGIEKLGNATAPLKFHLGNIGLHALAVALFGLAVWQMLRSRWATGLAALLFGLHPLLTDNVAYVSGRTDILAAIGLLTALLGLMRFTRRSDALGIVITVAGFALALFSKETGALFVLIAPLWLWATRRSRRLRLKDWLLFAGLFVVLAGYVAARIAVLGRLLPTTAAGSAANYPMLAAAEFGRLLGMFILPVSGRIFLWPAGFTPFTPLMIITIAYLLVPLAIRKRGLPAETGLAWLWVLVFLLPIAGVTRFGPLGRLLYVPAIGLVLLAILAARAAIQNRRKLGRPLVALGAFVCLAFVPLARNRMDVWQDGYTLFTRMTTEAPLNPAGHFNLAFALRSRNDPDGALAEYGRVMELDSTIALAYSNAAAILQSKGAFAEAANLYRKTLSLAPDYPLAHNNLGIILYKLGDLPGAITEIRRALELAPKDAGAAYNLARIYAQAGRADSAGILLEQAYRLEPDNPQIKEAWRQSGHR